MLTSQRSFIGHDRLAFTTPVGTESRTVQSSKEEADINTLVKRFGLTGQLPQNVRVPLSGDFTDAMDFRTAMDAILAAEKSFDAMPADVRKRFNNDPGDFVDFTTAVDSSGKLVNLDEMRKMGLAVPPAPPVIIPEPTRVVIVTPPA